MADTIKLKPADQVEFGLLPGELAVDEADRLLYVDLGDSSGPWALPLDILAIPEPEEAGVLLKTSDGSSFGPLPAGGGGRPLDQEPWCVPGVILTAYTTVLVNGTVAGVIEIGESSTVLKITCRPTVVADIDYVFGIRSLDGEAILEVEASAMTGPVVEDDYAVPLDPGRYEVYLTSPASLTVEAVQGRRRHQSALETFPVFLQVA